MECQKCGRIVENVGELTTKVTCSYCVLRAVGFPEEPKGYVPTGRPMGWHWMKEFVDKDGNVFHKGKEQPKLKGTLKPTKLNPPKKRKKKPSRVHTWEADTTKLAKQYKEKKKLQRAIRKQKDFLDHKIDKGGTNG